MLQVWRYIETVKQMQTVSSEELHGDFSRNRTTDSGVSKHIVFKFVALKTPASEEAFSVKLKACDAWKNASTQQK
jgi:hypothetical protein